GSIGWSTGDGQRGKYVESALVGKLTRILNLAHHVVGSQRRNGDSYLWTLEILAAEFLSQLLLELDLCQALHLDGASERQRDLTTLIELVLTVEVVFAKYDNSNFIARLKLCG